MNDRCIKKRDILNTHSTLSSENILDNLMDMYQEN